MTSDRSRIGQVLTQENGLKTREALLRVVPDGDLYVREKWSPRQRTAAVLLLHGAAMDGSGWDIPIPGFSLAEALAAAGAHTFALDFRAHGRSSRAPDGREVTTSMLIDDTLQVLEYVEEVTSRAQIVLVGESLGASIAWLVAERAPERVAALALLGLVFGPPALPVEVIQQAVAVEYGGYSYVREEEWANTTLATAEQPVIAWHQAQFGASFAFPIGILQGRELGYVPQLARISAPVLVVTGDRDPLVRPEGVDEFFAAIGSHWKRHVRQLGVGHLPYVDRQAGAVQKEILDPIGLQK